MNALLRWAVLGVALLWSHHTPANAADQITGPLTACPDVTDPELAKQFKLVPVPRPSLARRGEILIGGPAVTLAAHSVASFSRIPQAWSTFSTELGLQQNLLSTPEISSDGNRRGFETYAVCFNGTPSGEFNYMPGIEVVTLSSLSPSFNGVRLSPQTYAVFPYSGPRSGIGDFRYSLTSQYWPSSPYRRANAPNFEFYGKINDPRSEMVYMEMWVAIEPATVRD